MMDGEVGECFNVSVTRIYMSIFYINSLCYSYLFLHSEQKIDGLEIAFKHFGVSQTCAHVLLPCFLRFLGLSDCEMALHL